MAICLECGNSIGNTTRCSRCGGSRLRGLDPVVSGTSPTQPSRIDDLIEQVRAEPVVTGDATPSRESLREVKREGRRRRIGRFFKRGN